MYYYDRRINIILHICIMISKTIERAVSLLHHDQKSSRHVTTTWVTLVQPASHGLPSITNRRTITLDRYTIDGGEDSPTAQLYFWLPKFDS
jgi:hypothetical protein